MFANPAPLLEVLGVPKARFVIEPYQRGYAWKTEQRREYWDDIIRAGETGRTHFVGSVLLQRLEGNDTATSFTRFAVVDGQQRLVTTTILITCLIALLADDPELADRFGENMEAIRHDYVFDVFQKGDDRYRLIPSDDDRGTLWHVVNPDAPKPDHPSKAIMDAVADFDAWLADVDPRVVWRGIQKLIVIDARLSGDDDAQSIFESMNATGMGLGSFDLMRNWVLMQKGFDERADFHRDRWLPFARMLGDDPGERELFLRHWLTTGGHVVRGSNGEQLYHLFKRRWLDNDWDVDVEMDVLTADADAWRRMFHDGEDDPELARAYQRIGAFNVQWVRALMLVLHRALKDGRLDKTGMLDCCAAVESYLVRRTVLRLSNSSLAATVDRICRVLRDERSASVRDLMIASLLVSDRNENSWFPDDDAFRDRLTTAPLYQVKPQLAHFMLARIENERHPNERQNLDAYTVEHILPQTPSKEWRDAIPDIDMVEREWGDTIGNLTLSGSNSALSNKPFDEKNSLARRGYGASPLSINRDVAKATRWDADMIAARGHALAQEALTVWPYPKVPAGLVDDLRLPLMPKRSGNFRFAAHNIPVGATLVFDDPRKGPTRRDRHDTVTVVDRRNLVELDGETVSLSEAARRLAGLAVSARGPLFFTYDGTRLTDMTIRE